MFSRRSTFEPAEQMFGEVIPVRYDLTVSTPSAAGISPDTEATLDALRNSAAMEYQPDPRGLFSARKAVAAYYQGAISAEQVVLTASTSEAYSFLFRLLCDPGDEVLIPEPSYPLFDMLAAYDNVQMVRYPLRYDHGWSTDLQALASAITPQTRAILLVHPNNPTGHMASAEEQRQIDSLAAEKGIAVIADEVFLDYSLGDQEQVSFSCREAQALTFTLSGLSKVCALPQMKVAWICVTGPRREEALQQLDLIADSFLSVSTPAQLALPKWLAGRGNIQSRILDRARTNLAYLEQRVEGTAVSVLRVEAGWCAVLRVPAIEEDMKIALRLATEQSVRIQPGSFYGFPDRGYLVLSLLPESLIFRGGVDALLNVNQKD